MRFYTIPNGTTSDKERTNLMAPGGLRGWGMFDLKVSNPSDPVDPVDTTGRLSFRPYAGMSSDKYSPKQGTR